jgi:signal transduction histidine kinase
VPPAVWATLTSIIASLACLLPAVPTGAATIMDATAMIETGALLLVILLVMAKGPLRSAISAAAFAVVAVGITVLRFPAADNSLLTALGCTLWGLVAVAAAGAGGYLRLSAARRASELREVQRTQRLHLAADLHDFVAHDVSETLALAQAGQIVAPSDPARATEIFRNIETAAAHAMHSLDHTVAMLGDAETGRVDDAPRNTIAGLRVLAERFSRSGSARVDLDIDPEVTWAIRHRASAALYRVAVEALTNVRRHAPTASLVRIVARQLGEEVELSVSDNGGADGGLSAATRSSGGFGLSGLTTRVAQLGGTLTAGPQTAGGWRVVVRLPLMRCPTTDGTPAAHPTGGIAS